MLPAAANRRMSLSRICFSLIFWNQSAERLYGWSKLQVLGQSIETLLYGDPTHFRRATQATLEHGEWTGEIVQQHRDGSSIDVEGRWTLVRGDNGQPHSIRLTVPPLAAVWLRFTGA